ncbi:hypothetical protein V475_21220 [Sphingobium baderi LL03]|uniref:Uncharacterized protein n=1 Tax=Sphingobium baderi LL03 TaxID=1114964 RepID=T0HRZ6_9SPHN|nr:hypothetical protein L485_08900 [Sphingobium baderi LL03]KMS59083.1 hypothetical protein V475_21220 [Sphingobium baderi LL03]
MNSGFSRRSTQRLAPRRRDQHEMLQTGKMNLGIGDVIAKVHRGQWQTVGPRTS